MSPSFESLTPTHRPALEAFLEAHADSSMFLRSNLARAGLEDTGEVYSARWVGAFEHGALVAVAAHCWNGNLLLQAPAHVAPLAAAALRGSARPLMGIVGPLEQTEAARAGLGLSDAPCTLDSRDILYSLALGALRTPEDLARGVARCRRAEAADLDRCAQWRLEFCVESLGQTDSRALRREARATAQQQIKMGELYLLGADGAAVACSAFNASLPDCVQIGGVYTPPALRGRGYARAVVAGSLLEARARGVQRAILFTGEKNVPAQRAYRALGFEEVGSYGLLLFAQEQRPLRLRSG